MTCKSYCRSYLNVLNETLQGFLAGDQMSTNPADVARRASLVALRPHFPRPWHSAEVSNQQESPEKSLKGWLVEGRRRQMPTPEGQLRAQHIDAMGIYLLAPFMSLISYNTY